MATNARLIRWLAGLGLALTVAGLGVSIYLTISHYTTAVTLACPEHATINCLKVTSSSYASIHGVPLVLLGLLYFIVMIPLQLPAAWRSRNLLLRRTRLALTAIGVAMVFWLLYAELFKLNAICLYCTAIHIFSLMLFGLTAVGTAMTREGIAPDQQLDS